MFVAEEMVTVLVERILSFLLLAVFFYLIVSQTFIGQDLSTHATPLWQSLQGWLTEQHQSLNLDGLGSSISQAIDHASSQTQASVLSLYKTISSAS
jgi:hypothetical protein